MCLVSSLVGEGEDKGQKFKIVMSVPKMKNEFCLEVAVRLELNLYRAKLQGQLNMSKSSVFSIKKRVLLMNCVGKKVLIFSKCREFVFGTLLKNMCVCHRFTHAWHSKIDKKPNWVGKFCQQSYFF